ncbi:MAG: hypothetical protein HFJ03_10190 [Lachnospira sp.]|jgi:hypothetical protein|nr:hypothetical protein [Lachnospira sp.]
MRKFLGHVKRKDIRINKPLKIGIIGAGRGVGTTYLAMMAANFCANFKGFKTALVECNNNKDYMKICNETSNMGTDMYDFLYKNIQFISEATPKKIAQLELKGYHRIIFDCSVDYELGFIEFFRCDVRIVVCSTQLYKIGCTKKLLSDVKDIPVKAVVFCADKKAKAKIEKDFKRVIKDIPMEYNSLCIKPETCNWISQLLELSDEK